MWPLLLTDTIDGLPISASEMPNQLQHQKWKPSSNLEVIQRNCSFCQQLFCLCWWCAVGWTGRKHSWDELHGQKEAPCDLQSSLAALFFCPPDNPPSSLKPKGLFKVPTPMKPPTPSKHHVFQGSSGCNSKSVGRQLNHDSAKKASLDLTNKVVMPLMCCSNKLRLQRIAPSLWKSCWRQETNVKGKCEVNVTSCWKNHFCVLMVMLTKGGTVTTLKLLDCGDGLHTATTAFVFCLPPTCGVPNCL